MQSGAQRNWSLAAAACNADMPRFMSYKHQSFTAFNVKYSPKVAASVPWYQVTPTGSSTFCAAANNALASQAGLPPGPLPVSTASV